MKDKMILKNGTTIELEAGASLGVLQVRSIDQDAMLDTWKQLSEANLAEVSVQTGDGLTIGKYTNLVLVSEQSVVNGDGSVLTTFSLREKTAEELRLDALELEQEIQNGAIEELAEMAAGGGEE